MLNTYFNFSTPIDLGKKLFETKDKKKNNELVKLIRGRSSDLKDKTEKMSKEEIKTEKRNEILKIIKIFDFNKKNQKQQEGSGLKILIPTKCLVDYQLF